MNGVGRYLESEVVAAGGARLVVVAYDGAIGFLLRAQRAFEAGRPQEAPPLVFRAKRVVLYLLASLEPSAGGAVGNLSRLYGYVLQRLAEAALMQDRAALAEGIKVLTELRAAWAQVAESEAVPPCSEADSDVSVVG